MPTIVEHEEEEEDALSPASAPQNLQPPSGEQVLNDPSPLPRPASEPATVVLPAPFVPTQPETHVFGLRQDAQGTPGIFADDYLKRLPEDAYGEETQPNARVWRAYEEEAATFDTIMIGQARDGLDVMLVFAGLFSAVVTSFLVQVSQNLQADYSEMTALLLHDLVVMQLVSPDGASSSANITVPSADPTATFAPDALDVWINGLWAVSLAASLTVALSAVLVKQWLHHYVSLPSGTPGLRSHVRQRRFMGFERWHVTVIIGLLPIVMHASLALFLVGLVLFYIPLRSSLSFVVGFISLIVFVLYMTSNILPITQPDCPYHTPLTGFCFHFFQWFKIALDRAREWVRKLLDHISQNAEKVNVPTSPGRPTIWTLHGLETQQVTRNYAKLSVDALDWLFNVSSNPSLRSVVIEAVCGLDFEVKDYAQHTWSDAGSMRSVRRELVLSSGYSNERDSRWFPVQGQEDRFERLCRSSCFLPDMYVSIGTVQVAHPRLAAALAPHNPEPGSFHNVLAVLGGDRELQLYSSVWYNLFYFLESSRPQSALELPLALLISALIRLLSPMTLGDYIKVWTQPVSLYLFLQNGPHSPWGAIQQLLVLAQFNKEPGSPLRDIQVQIMLWEFTLHNWDNPDLPKSDVQSLLRAVISHVLSSLRKTPRKTAHEQDSTCRTAVSQLMLRVLEEQSFIGAFENDTVMMAQKDYFPYYRAEMKPLLESLSGIYCTVLEDRDFTFPALPRLLALMERYVDHLDDFQMVHIVWHALDRGHNEVLDWVFSHDWIGVDFKQWILYPDRPRYRLQTMWLLRLISSDVPPLQVKLEDRLHTPSNLFRLAILSIMDADHGKPGLDQLYLRPQHSSWLEVKLNLELLLAWTETDTGLSDPPPLLLDNDGTVDVSLLDQVRSAFSDEGVRVEIKILLRKINDRLPEIATEPAGDFPLLFNYIERQ